MTPLQAIKAFCFDCSGENRAEVKRCSSPKCPLFPYRTGHTAGRKMTEEQRAKAVERLQRAREVRE